MSAENEAPAMSYVEVSEGGRLRHRVALTGRRLLIGRGEAADIPIPGQSVSREHAALVRGPFGHWWINDLGSRNGTLLNGEPVTRSIVRLGEVIHIAGVDLVLHADVIPAPPQNRPQSSTADTEVPEDFKSLLDIQAPTVSANHVRAIHAFAAALMQTRDPKQRRESLCALLIQEMFPARFAAVVRTDATGDSEALEILVAQRRPDAAADPGPISRTLIHAARDREVTLLAGSVTDGGSAGAQRIDADSPSLFAFGEGQGRCAVACVVHRTDQGVELVYAALPASCGTGEWLAILDMTAMQYRHCEQMWTSRLHQEDHLRIERDLEAARGVQHQIVPTDISAEGLDIAIGFEPCHWVAGDYVDVIPSPDGRTLLAMADVCGKGMQAALVASSLHSIIHATFRRHGELDATMASLNHYLCRFFLCKPVTMIGLLIDAKTGNYDCVNAGHPAPIVLDAAGHRLDGPDADTYALGIDPDLTFTCRQSRLPRDHFMTFFTDGAFELTDPRGDILWLDRLAAFVATAAESDGSASTVVERLAGSLDNFQGGGLATDDRTLMTVRLR